MGHRSDAYNQNFMPLQADVGLRQMRAYWFSLPHRCPSQRPDPDEEK